MNHQDILIGRYYINTNLTHSAEQKVYFHLKQFFYLFWLSSQRKAWIFVFVFSEFS